MQVPHSSKIPKTIVRIQADKYLVRTIKPDDASERWASWMSEPEAMHMLNARPRNWQKRDIEAYIAQFDQRSRLLLGIFEKQTWLHIGIVTIDIDHATGEFRANYLIGEPEYRNKGVTNDITEPFRDYFFETLGLKKMMANALARNHVIIHYLLKTGWTLEETLKQHVQSRSDGTMLDLCRFGLTRDAWRAWKKAHPVDRSDTRTPA